MSHHHKRYFDNTLNDGPVGDDFPAKVDNILQRMKTALDAHPYDHEGDFTVYTGRAGRAFYHMLMSEVVEDEEKQEHLGKALLIIKQCLKKATFEAPRRISFLCGDPGIVSLAAVIKFKLGLTDESKLHAQQLNSMADWTLHRDFPDELLYGRSGFLYALLLVRDRCGKDFIPDETVRKLGKAIVKNGVEYSRRVKSPLPLMYEWHRSMYIGPAHGVSGILLILLQVKEFLSREEINDLVKPSIDKLTLYRYPSGNFLSSVETGNDDRLVHWCHGAPGVGLLYAEAAEHFPDSRSALSEVAANCADITWERGLLKKGYGLCHGAAGNAYLFLAAFKATGEEKYLHRAMQFANWCADFGKHGCSTPDEPYCFMNGVPGTAYFLTNIKSIQRSHKFPSLLV